MQISTARRVLIIIAWGILLTEVLLIVLNYEQVGDFFLHYGWVMPIFFFKSLVKKFLVINLFGLLKVCWGLLWHLSNLLLIKLLKTFGVRYGTYFTSRRWEKVSQRIRLFTKRIARKQRRFQYFILTFRKREYALIIIAFFPVFVLLFLFGIAFKITREAMVKKGSEFGVTAVAFGTARKSEGLIARLRRLDRWILIKIEMITRSKK